MACETQSELLQPLQTFSPRQSAIQLAASLLSHRRIFPALPGRNALPRRNDVSWRFRVDFCRVSTRPGRRSADIQVNIARLAVSDPIEDGAAIQTLPSESKLVLCVAFR